MKSVATFITRAEKAMQVVRVKLENPKLKPQRRIKLQKKIESINKQVIARIVSLNLNQDKIKRLTNKIKNLAAKIEECKEIGIQSFDVHLPATASQGEIESVVDSFNANPEVHSILVQLPLPDGIDEEQVLFRVNPAKDVDGLHPTNLGRLVMGAPGPLPCTPAGIVERPKFPGAAAKPAPAIPKKKGKPARRRRRRRHGQGPNPSEKPPWE